MKPLIASAFIAASAMLAPAANADSFHPFNAAVQYCTFRNAGVGRDEAIRLAIMKTWDPERPRYMTNTVAEPGRPVNSDVLAFVEIVGTLCPGQFR